MRHRTGNTKIKHQHHMVPGLRRYLERVLAPLPETQALIPGRIEPKKTSGHAGFRMHVQYATSTGLKLLAHGRGAVQEVFVVTNNPARIEDAVKQNPRN